MVSGKRRVKHETEKAKKEEQNEYNTTEYEQLRQQRIKENLQRMEKMGILELSRNLGCETKPPPLKKPKKSQIKIPSITSSESTRHSSRLNNKTRVNYAENVHSPNKARRAARNTDIHIKQGSEPENYTAEHEKLLGDCKTTWDLYVDGCDKHGKRIYDQIEGKSCHQCRQKTLGQHTECSSCKTGRGQFCGDCLFMRYGENVIEVNQNPRWICPVCRGICNCSCCRQKKGWKPTGSIYKKVKHLGFKSVAHYLIQARPSQTIQKEPTCENPHPENGLLPIIGGESEPTHGISKTQSDYIRSEEIKEDSDFGSISGGTPNQDGSIEDYDAVDNDEE